MSEQIAAATQTITRSKVMYEEACELIAQLLDVRSLRENERQFVDDLHGKLDKYGERTYVSEKQMDWLRALAKTHWRDPRQGGLFS